MITPTALSHGHSPAMPLIFALASILAAPAFLHAAGDNPFDGISKIETRKLGTLFIKWKGVDVVSKEPCL
jgi:hypothetical protein